MLHVICSPAKVWNPSRWLACQEKPDPSWNLRAKKKQSSCCWKISNVKVQSVCWPRLVAQSFDNLLVQNARTCRLILELALCKFQLAAVSRVDEAAGWDVSWAARSCSRAARGRVSMTPTLCVWVGGCVRACVRAVVTVCLSLCRLRRRGGPEQYGYSEVTPPRCRLSVTLEFCLLTSHLSSPSNRWCWRGRERSWASSV